MFTYFSNVAVDALFQHVQHEVGPMTFVVKFYVTCLTFKLHLHTVGPIMYNKHIFITGKYKNEM